MGHGRSLTLWDSKGAASKEVIRVIPLRPSTRLVHMAGTSFPTGVTAPRPVTTTRLISLERVS
jgi:hypothetical protein